jgi:polyphosphate kinase
VLDVEMADPRGAWDMQPDGSYVQRRPDEGAKARHSQQTLIDRAEKRLKEATRLRKRKPKGVARRAQG